MSPTIKAKLISVAKGAGIAGAGAVLTYLAQLVTTGSFDGFGPYAAVIAMALSVTINIGRKFLDKPIA